MKSEATLTYDIKLAVLQQTTEISVIIAQKRPYITLMIDAHVGKTPNLLILLRTQNENKLYDTESVMQIRNGYKPTTLNICGRVSKALPKQAFK